MNGASTRLNSIEIMEPNASLSLTKTSNGLNPEHAGGILRSLGVVHSRGQITPDKITR